MGDQVLAKSTEHLGPPFRIRIGIALLLWVVAGRIGVAQKEIAHFRFTESVEDRLPPRSRLVRAVGDPRRTEDGVTFEPAKVQGLLYGDGAQGELRLEGEFTLWVRAAFGPAQTGELANHDTLISRWGPLGAYGFLLRSDHGTGTLRFFVSPDGRTILDYDSGYRVDRSGDLHDLAVVYRANKEVAFFVDGRVHSTRRLPSPPAVLLAEPASPFAIGYSSDPTPEEDHEGMHGTIREVRVFRGALDSERIARLSGVRLAGSAPVRRRIEVDLARPIGPVHPRLFGHSLEHFQDVVYGGVWSEPPGEDAAAGLRSDTLEAWALLAPPVIRWPGGHFTSAYHWRWGAVPQKYRPTIHDEPVWHARETNRFGTPEFLELCRRLGAEPLICVGVGRAAHNPTAEEAAAWVRYCNAGFGEEAELRAEAGSREPFPVLLWGLGHEVWGPGRIGQYRDPARYAADVVRYAGAMRKADPRLRFVVCGDSYKADLLSWNRAVLTDEVVRLADWISYHSYTHLGSFGTFLEHGAAAVGLLRVEEDLIALKTLNREVSRRAKREEPIAVAVDEWNEFGRGSAEDNARPELYSLSHALFTASFLNILLRQADGVTLGGYSPSINARGLLRVDSRGVLRRASFHTFALYRGCAGGTVVTTTVAASPLTGFSVPELDAAAVLSGEKVLLFVVNRQPELAIPARVEIPGFPVHRSEATVLTGASLEAFNDFSHPEAVVPRSLPCQKRGQGFHFEFPPRSLSLLTLSQ